MKVNHLVWSKSEKIRYNEALKGSGVSIPSNALRGLSIWKMAKEDRESFVMYGSFLAAAEKALNYEGVGKFVLLLRDYAIKGEDAHSEDPVIEALLMMAKPNVSAAQGRYDKAKKGGESGNKGADHGWKGGRPRKGETKEEYDERKRKERELKESELMQEQAAEPKTAVETRQNPKNPLNVNVNANVNENEKENDNADVDVKENTNIKGKEDGNEDVDAGGGFVDSLILNDFDDEEEEYSYGEGSASAYMERLRLQEEEERVRSFLEELEGL